MYMWLGYINLLFMIGTLLEKEMQWKEEENSRLITKSRQLGCSIELVKYIESLTESLESKIKKLDTHSL